MSASRQLRRSVEKGERNLKMELAENEICSAVGKVLVKHYPGWKWYVECKHETGVVSVRNLTLNGDYGFIVHLAKLVNDVEMNLVRNLAGELLERYGQRAMARPEVVEVDRDIKGNAIGDTHGAA